MAEDRARVFAFIGESRRERTVFDGTEEDAKQYLEHNFPRPHIEPGEDYGDDGPPVDAVLDVNGVRTKFDGKAWSEWTPPTHLPAWTKPDERDRVIADLQAQLAARDTPPAVQSVPVVEMSEEDKQIAELEAQLATRQKLARIKALQAELSGAAPAEPSPADPPPVEPIEPIEPIEPAIIRPADEQPVSE